MEDIKKAIELMPLFRELYERDIIDIEVSSFKYNEYVLITEKLFRELFPDVEPNEKSHLIAWVEGVRVIAVAS